MCVSPPGKSSSKLEGNIASVHSSVEAQRVETDFTRATKEEVSKMANNSYDDKGSARRE